MWCVVIIAIYQHSTKPAVFFLGEGNEFARLHRPLGKLQCFHIQYVLFVMRLNGNICRHNSRIFDTPHSINIYYKWQVCLFTYNIYHIICTLCLYGECIDCPGKVEHANKGYIYMDESRPGLIPTGDTTVGDWAVILILLVSMIEETTGVHTECLYMCPAVSIPRPLWSLTKIHSFVPPYIGIDWWLW